MLITSQCICAAGIAVVYIYIRADLLWGLGFRVRSADSKPGRSNTSPLTSRAAAAPGLAPLAEAPALGCAAQVLAACGMKREMDAATLERRAAAIADKWAGAPDSHEPAAAAAAALEAGAALAAHFVKTAEALQEPGLFARLAGVAFLPADQVCACPCCPSEATP